MTHIAEERKAYIREIVNSLLSKSLDDIVREEKIDLLVTDTSIVREWVSGIILYSSTENKFKIYINSSDPKNRQRFTLAHELGHYFLHKDYLQKKQHIVLDNQENIMFRPSVWQDDDEETRKNDEEANFFAAELLMPEDMVRRARWVTRDIKALTEIFQVSPIAITYRLTNLWLLNND